jgi:hypothetical protein
VNNPYLLKGLVGGPLIVRRIVSNVPESRHDDHTDPDRFTLREAVAHVADWDAIDLGRIKQILSSPGSTLQPFDETERSILHDYVLTDVGEQLALFSSRRAALVAFLETMPAESWAEQGFHPEKGVLTVYDMANLILAHDTYHIEHLTQFL